MKRTQITVYSSLVASMLFLLACGGPSNDAVKNLIENPTPGGMSTETREEADDLARSINNDPTGLTGMGVEEFAGTCEPVDGQTGDELLMNIATGEVVGYGHPVESVELTQTEDDERYTGEIVFEDGTTRNCEIVVENGDPKLVVPIMGN